MKTLTLLALLVNICKSSQIILAFFLRYLGDSMIFFPSVAFSSRLVDLCRASLCPEKDFGSIACHNRQPWLWHCKVCQNIYVKAAKSHGKISKSSNQPFDFVCVLGLDLGQSCTELWGLVSSTLPLLALKVF